MKIQYDVYYKKYRTVVDANKQTDDFEREVKTITLENTDRTTAAMARNKFLNSLSKKDKKMVRITDIKLKGRL